MRKRMVSVALIFFIGLSLTGCPKQSSTSTATKSALESQIKSIKQMLTEIKAEIAKHQNNIENMRNILRNAQQTGTTPNVGGLKEYANAAGERTPAYHQAPPWKQDLIDKFENMHVFNAMDAAALGAATTDGNVEEVYIKVEIRRTSRFIRMLEVLATRQGEVLAQAEADLQRINETAAPSSTTTADEGLSDGGY